MLKSITLIVNFLLFTALANAQYCSPTGNCTRNDYINNFSMHTISNLSSQGSNCGTFQNPGPAYINTGMSATVEQGKKYAMTVRGRPGFAQPQGFGIWIDFNQDQDFDDAGEFVSASPLPTNQNFNDSIEIPLSAKTGTTRMRVRSLRANVISATQSCATFNTGETEDYTLVITAAPIPPQVDFEAKSTFSCTGLVEFFDLTPNTVTSRLWDFGDGNTDTSKNPVHTYTSGGTYTVKLTSINGFGSNSETKINYITVSSTAGPIAPNCSPKTLTSAAGFGITSFQFGTINQSSGDATIGYEDFACVQSNVTQGQSYTMTISTAGVPANQNYRAWIDFNGDGVFTSQENVMTIDNAQSGVASVTIPPGSVLNKPLRMRIAAVYFLTAPSGATFTSCSDLTNGQMEDYSIQVIPNTQATVADFRALQTRSCDGIVDFEDLSQNVPTSWTWDFGDANSSNSQHPQHTYAASGTYTVKLSVTNQFGQDSLVKTNYVTVDLSSNVTAACMPKSLSHRDDYGIHYVLFNSINNITDDGREGYQDFSCTHLDSVEAGKSYNIEVKTGGLNKEDVTAWIDFNNDGQFNETTEKVWTSVNDTLHKGTISIVSSATTNVPLRMRITSDVVGTQLKSCDDATYGQSEDYAVIVKQSSTSPQAPDSDFMADSTKVCKGQVKFTDNSTNSPTSWLWEFGDGNTSILKDPTHQYLAQGKYTVKLTASNAHGSNTETKTAYVDFDELYCFGGNPDGIVEWDASSIRVFPNPTNGKLNIAIDKSDVQKFSIRVLSVQGQIIYLGSMEPDGNSVKTLDLSGEQRGLYFIEIQSGEQVYLHKIMLN